MDENRSRAARPIPAAAPTLLHQNDAAAAPKRGCGGRGNCYGSWRSPPDGASSQDPAERRLGGCVPPTVTKASRTFYHWTTSFLCTTGRRCARAERGSGPAVSVPPGIQRRTVTGPVRAPHLAGVLPVRPPAPHAAGCSAMRIATGIIHAARLQCKRRVSRLRATPR